MNDGRKIELVPISDGMQKRGTVGTKEFLDASGSRISIDRRLIVRVRDPKILEKYIEKYRLKLVRKYGVGDLYLLEAPTVEEAIKVANAMGKDPEILLAQPNVGKRRMLR